ncbi:MAG: sigma-70 family RNA polymerase sigma factor [Phycisphaerales bacterium]|nr:MAG: sigma-70 family RNA polymerase sigma factor [Phycisphaerales bacterium]
MRYEAATDIGGVQGEFLTTHWTLVEGIQAKNTQQRALIDLLIRRYWKPVYCYLRQKGYSNEQAKDLTQGFFQEVVLGRELILRADPSKGRFRSFLLHALKYYALNERAKETAQMRAPKNGLTSLDSIDPQDIPESVLSRGPEASYDYAWVSALLDEVLAAVEASCRENGLDIHWELFNARLVQPILTGQVPPPLQEIGEAWGVDDPSRASNMIIAAKRRFRETLRRCVRRTVADEGLTEGELEEIVKFLPESAQDYLACRE